MHTLTAILDEHLLRQTIDAAAAFLRSITERPVGLPIPAERLRATLGGPLRDEGLAPERVIHDLVHAADSGLVASAGPRYFGFVIGGSHPVAVAADWLTSAWDQNAGPYVSSPAAAVVEEVTASWLLDILDLPSNSGVGFVTGATMANFTCLAAARHAVLRRAGWDVEADGLQGAPRVNVVAGEEAHVTIFAALRMLGLGSRNVRRVPTDSQGRMQAGHLPGVLAGCTGPTIVCAQVGNVNTGAFDPVEEVACVAHEHGAWLHVDGAFGLWAAAAPDLRERTAGVGQADSWSTDAHKWLNVPYDSGLAIVKDAYAHRAAMSASAAYLMHAAGRERDNFDWVPEFSRRARGIPIYATLRSLGRRGIGQLVSRSCGLARLMAERLRAAPGVEVLNDVVLNQVLVRFHPPAAGDSDAFTQAVVARVQRDGTCWLGSTIWHGMAAMRISVSNWSTTEADADVSVEAMLRCAREVAATQA
jgi:glutamate/tyrosine decarboxylase-like PLP-dependent enzyme